jgi:hypothetical protein
LGLVVSTRTPQLKLSSALARAAVPLLTFVLYLAAYAPLAHLPGADVPYYWLGVRHLQEGRLPWAGEPPLSFLLLWPLTLIAGDHLGYVLLAAAGAATAVWLCGRVALLAAGASGGGARASTATELGGQVLAMAFASPHFVNCFLKNNLANALALAALVVWFGRSPHRRWLAPLTLLLAIAAHPGAPLPLVIAAALTAARAVVGRVGLRAACGHARRALPWLAGSTLVVAAAAGPTGLAAAVSRYAATYLRAESTAGSPFAGWDTPTLVVRYLPLWIILAAAAAAVRGVRSEAAAARRGVRREAAAAAAVREARSEAAAARCGVRREAAAPGALRELLWAWVFVQLALSVVGGQASARLGLQQYMPLVILAAVHLGPRLSRKSVAGLAAAAVFGLLTALPGLHLRPMLSPGELAALAGLRHQLPPGSKVVCHATSAPYWLEYLSGLPVVGPNLMPERGLTPGPVFLLTEDPVRDGGHWPRAALASLREGGRLVWQYGRFMLLAANDDPRWFQAWPKNRTRPAMELVELDQRLWPASPGAPEPGILDRGLAWLLFAPTGLMLLAGLNVKAAAGAGLVVSYAAWAAGWSYLSRRRTGQLQAKEPSGR